MILKLLQILGLQPRISKKFLTVGQNNFGNKIPFRLGFSFFIFRFLKFKARNLFFAQDHKYTCALSTIHSFFHAGKNTSDIGAVVVLKVGNTEKQSYNKMIKHFFLNFPACF